MNRMKQPKKFDYKKIKDDKSENKTIIRILLLFALALICFIIYLSGGITNLLHSIK